MTIHSEIADRWAGLWRGDAAPAGVYRDDAIYWQVERSPGESEIGPDAAGRAVNAFLDQVDEVEVEVYRTFGTGSELVIEAIISGIDHDDNGVRKATGVCAAIDFDANGKITREQLHMQWRGRRDHTDDVLPYVPDQDNVDRGAAFWWDLTDRQLRPWGSPDANPDGMVDAAYAEEGYYLDSMISKQTMRLDGREMLRAAEHELLNVLPIRETCVARLIHGGNAAYVWHPVHSRAALDAPLKTWSSLMVLTVNPEGRIISEHTYLPSAWKSAVA